MTTCYNYQSPSSATVVPAPYEHIVMQPEKYAHVLHISKAKMNQGSTIAIVCLAGMGCWLMPNVNKTKQKYLNAPNKKRKKNNEFAFWL